MKDYYKILGLQSSASAEQIKVAFRTLVLKWHPDRNSDRLKAEAHKRFIEIYEAYDILSDPEHRKQYDILFKYEFIKGPYYEEAYVKTRTREKEAYERRKAEDDLKQYVNKARKLAEEFSGEYFSSFWERFEDRAEAFWDLPFSLLDRLKFDKTQCPLVEEIIHFAYIGFKNDNKRLHIYNHIRFCKTCRKIHYFFTKKAKGSSCPTWSDLRNFFDRTLVSKEKYSIIRVHIEQCERCKCIAGVVKLRKNKE